MDEFDDDDFCDLYADIEVQASSAISSIHGISQMIQGEKAFPDCGADGLTQLPMEILKNATVGEERCNGLGETEMDAGNGDVCRDEVVLREEDGDLITSPSEDCDTQGSESEDESDGGSDGDKQMLDVDYDDAGEYSEGGEDMKNGHQSYGDSLSHQKYMGLQSAIFSSNSDDSYRGRTDLVNNDCKQLIHKTPVVGRDSSNSPIPQSRGSTHAPAFSPPHFDKHGAVHISDSEEDNEAYGCDSDGIVELSRSGRNEREPRFSSSFSPSVAHGNDDKEQSRKRLKNNSSGPVTEVQRSASCNTKNGLYSEGDRTLIKKEVKQCERSNNVHNRRNCLNENATPFGFDVGVLFDRHRRAISYANQRAMFGHGPNWQNMPYCQAPETFFPYFGGFLPGGHLPPAYLSNYYWNIYSSFGYEASHLNVQNIAGNGNYLEKKGTELDKTLEDKRNHNDRRNAIEEKVTINVDESRKCITEYSHAADERSAQFSKRDNDMQFKNTTERDYMPPLREHSGDFVKGKDRRFLPSYRDRHRFDHRDNRISHDRREVERHGRGNDRYHSPLKKSDSSSQLENGYNRRQLFKSHCVDHRDDRISHDRREVERHRRGNDRYHCPLKKSDNSSQLENRDNSRRFFKSQPSPFQSFEEPRAPSSERFKVASRPKFVTSERYIRSFSKERDTSKSLRCCEGRDHIQERIHYEQHADTFSSTGTIKFHHDKNDIFKRKLHQLSEVSHQDEKYKSRHPKEILCYEDPLFQSEKISRTTTDDRYASDSVTGFIDRREVDNGTCKMKREGGHSTHFDRSLRSADPDENMIMRPEHQELVDRAVFVSKKSSRRTSENEDVAHSAEGNENLDSYYEGKLHRKQADENLHKKSSENQKDKFLDIEEGQIITEELVKQNKKVNENLVTDKLDDQKIQEIMAKMERRRERFKEPVAVNHDTEKTSKPLTSLDVEITESVVKIKRPARKRKWAGN